MKIAILVGSSVLSISIFAFFLNPSLGHFASITTLFICLAVMGAKHTMDEHRSSFHVWCDYGKTNIGNGQHV